MPQSQFSNQILCPHFSICSGCELDSCIDSPPVYLEAQEFFLNRGVDSFKLHTGPSVKWRTRAKLAVRGLLDSPLIGLYRRGSHEVVEIPQCAIHHPNINRTVLLLERWIQEEKIPPYDEKKGKGLVRYLQLVVQRSTGKVQLSLVLNTHLLPEKLKLSLQAFWNEHRDLLHSIWINFNQRRDNVIFSSQWSLFHGEHFLWENISQREICFHPSSFAQANLSLFEVMIQKIGTLIPEKSQVAEFYAGVGIIGLSLVEKCAKISCCEITPTAKECFEESKQKLPPELKEKIQFFSGNVKEHLNLLDAAVIILDPPRKGVDNSLLEKLKNLKPDTKLIYISCGWEAFKRDCEILLKDWELKQAESYLFFPGTNFIETLAVFKK